MKQKVLITLLMAVFMAFSGRIAAQRFTFPVHDEGMVKSADKIYNHNNNHPALPDTITATSYLWAQMQGSSSTSWPNVKTLNSFVKMYVNQAYDRKVLLPYLYRMTYTVNGFRNPNTPNVYDVINDTLTIGYNPDSSTAYQDMQIKSYSGYYKTKVIITAIYKWGAGNTLNSFGNQLTGMDTNFNVEVTVNPQVYTKSNYKPQDMNLFIQSGTPINNGSLLPVTWNLTSNNINSPLNVEPANYELEWTYIDDYFAGSYPAFDFKNNATRVVVRDNHYNIPLTYQSGYLAYRVRMVRPDSVLLKTPIYGNWTSPDQGTVSGNNSYYVSAHMGDSTNWQYTISFAEDGKFKHVMSYFDGLLYNRQSITRFNTSPDKLIVTQNVYDYEGHPSIKTLPAPVNNNYDFRYQNNVALHGPSQQPYRASFFDTIPKQLCPQEPQIAPLSNNSLASIYYSPLNPDQSGFQKFVPDAGGYPLVQTIYAPGYDKRIERQGGAGDTLQIGRGHDTKYQFVGADQMDLNRLLGLNSGIESFYHKTVSRDPNGQYAVSIKDYEDKQIMSALIGEAPDPARQALVDNDNLPADSMYYSDLLAGTTQQITPEKRLLNKTIFMDAAATDYINYSYYFEPYQICTGYPNLGLSVNAHYKYSVIDECGRIKDSSSGTLGTLGVIPNATPVTGSIARTAYLDKGKYVINKELTVNEAEVDQAIDSFFNYTPTCVKTGDYFIRKQVEATQFPCPAAEDECSKLRREMMDELFPNAKYGHYTNTNGSITWNVSNKNSIFDIIQLTPPLEGSVYRYQHPCVTTPTGLGSVVINKNGQTYTRLDTVPVNLFIELFSGTEGYKIAEQLLPLHPEYCKLQACFIDTFETRFQAIPNATVAANMGLLTLDNIVNNDPLAARLNNVNPAQVYTASYYDSLKVIKNIGGIDTVALKLAYCNCTDPTVSQQCSVFFGPQIGNLTLPPSQSAKDVYFKNLQDMYLFNRKKYKSYLYAMNRGCGPCATPRMNLIPQPLIPTYYNPDGSLDLTSPSSAINQFNPSIQTVLLSTLNSTPTSNSTTVTNYQNSATAAVQTGDSTLGQIQIDTIVARMGNCPQFTSHKTAFIASLQTLISNGTVHYGKFSPTQVRNALTDAGITTGDLCNPYVVSYDYFTDPGGSAFGCKSDQYYSDAKDFLNNNGFLGLLNTLGSGSLSLTNNNNLFAQDVFTALALTGTSANVAANITYNNSTYTIELTSPTNIFVFHLKGGNGSNIFGQSGVAFSKVSCIKDQGSFSASGYVGNYVFGAEVVATTSQATTTYPFIGWNEGVFQVNTNNANLLSACIPCTEMKKLYPEFIDSMQAYSVNGTDHPLFTQMLRSFMNYRLQKVFGRTDYTDFIQSCALADTTELPRYMAYGKISGNVSGLINAVAANGISLHGLIRYTENGVDNMLVDYNNIPANNLSLVNSQITAYGGTVNTPFTAGNNSLAGWLILPGSNATVPSALSSLFAFSSGSNINVYIGGGYQPYTKFVATINSGTQPWQLSRNMETVRGYLYANGVQGYWLTTRQSTINTDYYKPEKQSLLHYTYSLQPYNESKVLDSLAPANLLAQIPGFSGMNVGYQLPSAPGALSNLYYTGNTTLYSGYTKLQSIVGLANSYFGGTNLFMASTALNHQIMYLSNNQSLHFFRCADGSFWYRFFDGNDKLYNVFIDIPDYIYPQIAGAMSMQSMAPDMGDTTSRKFTITAVSNGQTYLLHGKTDFDLSGTGKLNDVLLAKDPNPVAIFPGSDENCEQLTLDNAIYIGKINYDRYIDSFKKGLKPNFLAWIKDHTKETFTMGYSDKRFNITLYNYDRAGNLIETVPPEGVHKLPLTIAAQVDGNRNTNTVTTALLPDHHKESHYYYNSLNQLVKQTTPDGGEVNFYYDAVGRQTSSQNDAQKPLNKFSYTMYDDQSRIIETGQAIAQASVLNNVTSIGDLSFGVTFPREDVVTTTYDKSYIDLSNIYGLSKQENLRKRIACIKYFDALPAKVSGDTAHTYRHATHYSYDIEGNVKTLTQDFPELAVMSQQYKRIDYDYDVWSGKVNQMSYNRGFADQFYQRYSYDADNRIVKAESSPDGVIWKQEASYDYYQHGPLGRARIGDLRIQGMDYAYTIQGWLKSINGDTLAPTLDMGQDGLSAHSVRDAYATTIDYFKGDYRPIGNIPVQHLPQQSKSLYNGNIARQSSSIMPFSQLVTEYTYDQLNRIKKAQNFQTAQPASNPVILAATDAYGSNYQYDMDGNIKRLVRKNALGATLDTLNYFYNASQYNNRLQNVTDYAPNSNGNGNDLPQMTNANNIPYLYDGTGRVIKDKISNQDTLTWNVYNKLKTAENRAAKTTLRFGYDGSDNRVFKSSERKTDTNLVVNGEYYVRDASGNILAVYKNTTDTKDSLVSILSTLQIASGFNASLYVRQILTPEFTSEPAFKQYMIDQAAALNVGVQPVSFYLKAQPSLVPQFLTENDSYLDSLQDYETQLGKNAMGSALMVAARDNDEDLWQVFSQCYQAGLAGSDVDFLLTAIPGDIADQLCARFRISPDADEATRTAGLWRNMQNPGILSSAILSLSATDMQRYFGAIVHTTDWLSNTNLFHLGTRDLMTEKLADYAAPDSLYGFIDAYSQSWNKLTRIADVGQRQQLSYDDDPATFVDAVTNVAGSGVIDAALAQVPNLNVQLLMMKIAPNQDPTQMSNWYNVTVLKSRKLYLAEHHIYGSSRVGIMSYLPSQFYYLYDYKNHITDTTTLTLRTPWYSSELQSLIATGSVLPYSNQFKGTTSVQYILGLKQYELSNHLGNVQVVLSDKRYTKDINNDNVLDVSNPVISAAYDYYPYGMLMPGRYIQSNGQTGCIYTTQTQWVPQWVYDPPQILVPVVSGSVFTLNGKMVITAPSAGDGVGQTMETEPGAQYSLSVPVESVDGGSFHIGVTEVNEDGVVQEIAGKDVLNEGDYLLEYAAKGTSVAFNITSTSNVVGSVAKIVIPKMALPPGKIVYVQQSVLIPLCGDAGDKYRFGWNTQEKVNEIAGIGNWNSALYWEYATREVQRKVPDPVTVYWESPYAICHGNPILNSDVHGNFVPFLAFGVWWTAEALFTAGVVLGATGYVGYEISQGLDRHFYPQYHQQGDNLTSHDVPMVQKSDAQLVKERLDRVVASQHAAVTATAATSQAAHKAQAQSTPASDPVKNRVKPRASTLKKVKENQPTNEAGEAVDPNDELPLGNDAIDLGHKPGNEWRTRQEMHRQRGSTRADVIEAENDPDLYQYERRSNNRSHKYELKDGQTPPAVTIPESPAGETPPQT